jgi:archaellum component FlaC
MRIIDQLVYKITADTKGAEKGLDTTGKKFDAVGKIAKVAMGAVTVGAVVKVVKELGNLAVQSTVVLDRVDKMSQKIGMSRQGFQEWDYILAQTGANIDGLQMSMKTLSTQADAVTKGGSEATAMFEKLGVEVLDVNGKMKDQEALFSEVFLALSDLESETERTAMASRLLGRSATELAPAMNQGSDEIEKLRDDAHSLGLVYEDELIDSGVRLGDNILALTKAFEAFKTKAIAPVVGLLVQVTDRMLGQVTTASKLKDSLDTVETALQRYKSAQSEARDSTDVLTQSMETQALAVLRTALLDMIKVYEEAQKELPKLNKSVAKNIRLQGAWEKVIGDADKAWESITKNTKFAGDSFRDFVSTPDIDQVMWQITNELLGLGWGMKETQVATEQLRRSWWDYGEAVEELSKLQRDKLELDTKIGESTQGQEALIRSLAMAYVDGDRELIEYIKHNEEIYNKTMAMVDAIELHNYAVDKAKNVIAGFSTKTLESTQALIDRYEKMDTATLSTEMLAVRTEVLNQLYVKQSELLAEQAKETEDLAEKEKARKAIIDLANEAVERAVEYHEALGEAFDLDAEKTSIYTNAIKDLIDSGLAPTDGRITELLGKMPKLAEVTEEFVDSTKSAEDIMGEWNEELWESSYQLQVAGDLQAYYRRMIGATQDAMVDMLRNGIEPSSEEFQKLARMVEGFNKKLAESEEKSEEWKNTTVSVLREVSSVFSSLGALMSAQSQARLQELDEQLNKELDLLDKAMQRKLEQEGVLEETKMERLQKELEEAIRAGDDETADLKRQAIRRLEIEEEFADKKLATEEALATERKRLEREQAQRDKALAIFSAIIDTASAIIKAMPNIPLMAFAGVTGALQLATIASQPLPSFDVGSMRIERDTQAVVHRNEMILPAPLAEQARREGVAIGPAGGSDIHLQVFMDSKPIIDTTVKGINSGRYGKIDARVVK